MGVRMARPNRRPFYDCVIGDAFLTCDNGVDGKILDQGEDARGHPTGQCKYLLERLDRLDFFSRGIAAMSVWIMSENSASSRQFGR